MTPRRIAACAVVCGVLSCQPDDSVVVVSVTTAAGVEPMNQLRASMSNGAATSVKLYPQQPAKAPLDFTAAPLTFAVVVPRARAGAFDVAVDGLFVAPPADVTTPVIVGTGPGRAFLDPGGRTDVSILLLPGPAACGNGVLDPGEPCDDGNRFSGDGCDFRCQNEATGAGGAAGAGGQGGAGKGAGGAVPATGEGGNGPGGAAGTAGAGGRAG